MDDIRVHIVKYESSVNLLMWYRDPATGKQVARTNPTLLTIKQATSQ